MHDVELRARDALSPSKRDRFEFLLQMRRGLARTSAEMSCWGVGNTTMLDQQLVLVEDALIRMLGDARLAATLSARWTADDNDLLHQPGAAPEWCAVCQHNGYSLNHALGTLLGS